MKSPKTPIKKTSRRHVIIIGSGPAGLTAGYELTQVVLNKPQKRAKI